MPNEPTNYARQYPRQGMESFVFQALASVEVDWQDLLLVEIKKQVESYLM